MNMFKRWNGRGLLLWVIFLVGFWLTLKSSSDNLPGWFRGTLLEPLFLQFSTGNQNTHDIAVGVMVSLFIYFLVVWLPDRDKRKRVRQNLQLQYDSFKERCIAIFLSAMGPSFDPAVIDSLKDREAFMRFFKEGLSPGQTRWDAVANGLKTENINSLIIEFEIFVSEVRFILIAVDVQNEDVFAFLKQLAIVLYRARDCSPDYDGVESLLRLMWHVFAGWSFVEGYIKKDQIAGMIDAL